MSLFDAKAVSYSSLVKKYDNFLVPAMVLKVNGKDVRKISGIHICQVDVQLALDNVCSASFVLEDVYDLEKRSFSSDIKNNFQLGSTVSIQLGYGSAVPMVFSGYIHEMQYSFSDTPSISVTALDMRRLMMMNKENRTFTDKSYSDIFKEVVGKYSKAYKSMKVEAMTDKIEKLAQNMTDYDFVVKELCQKANKEFFVLGGDVYFQAKSQNKSPLITLTWGESLISFNISRTYRNEEIAVYGLDEKNVVVAKEKVNTEGSMKKLTSQPLKQDIISTSVKDQKGAKLVAKQEAEKAKRKSRHGSGSCIGIPELVPGRYIKIAKVDVGGESDVVGYLSSVKHSFGESGFTTDFEMGG